MKLLRLTFAFFAFWTTAISCSAQVSPYFFEQRTHTVGATIGSQWFAPERPFSGFYQLRFGSNFKNNLQVGGNLQHLNQSYLGWHLGGGPYLRAFACKCRFSPFVETDYSYWRVQSNFPEDKNRYNRHLVSMQGGIGWFGIAKRFAIEFQGGVFYDFDGYLESGFMYRFSWYFRKKNA